MDSRSRRRSAAQERTNDGMPLAAELDRLNHRAPAFGANAGRVKIDRASAYNTPTITAREFLALV